MSNELFRARFFFGTDSELRYILALPVVGDSIAHRRKLWRVTSATQDELGFSIVCQPRLRTTRDADLDPV